MAPCSSSASSSRLAASMGSSPTIPVVRRPPLPADHVAASSSRHSPSSALAASFSASALSRSSGRTRAPSSPPGDPPRATAARQNTSPLPVLFHSVPAPPRLVLTCSIRDRPRRFLDPPVFVVFGAAGAPRPVVAAVVPRRRFLV